MDQDSKSTDEIDDQREPSGNEERGNRTRWKIGLASVALAIALGIFLGTGAFTFGYGQGHSYFSNNPQSCVNCHAMQDHFNSWVKSSHHAVAVCNDCHLPHDYLGKWITKADNGFFHSLAFTLGGYKDPIQIKDRNRKVTQNSCIYCHQDTVHEMLPATPELESLSCIHCHSSVGHAQR